MENVLRSISSQGILAQDKVEIMQQAVAKCPKISISSKGLQIPPLLDSGSKVSLICYSHFKEHLLPNIEAPMGEKSDAHVLFKLTAANDGQLPVKKYIELDINAHVSFKLTAANDGQLPVKKYIELDINFLGLKVPNMGFLILGEPNRVLDKKHQTKLPGIINWNLIWLGYKVFVDKYGEIKFNSFECPGGVNLLLFSELCLYYYVEISKEHDYGVQSIYHQTDKDDISPEKLAHLAKKKSNHLLLVKMD